MASQSHEATIPPPVDETAVYKQLENYDWAADTEFQSGLQAILGSTADPERADHLMLRARCFYFSRKRNIRIDFQRYLAWRSSQSVIATQSVNGASIGSPSTSADVYVERRASVTQQYDDVSSPSEPPAPYPTSFDQIVELISTGQPIPGIKDVPGTVLEGQASQTTKERRRKPWEKHDAGVVASDGLEAT